MDWDFPGYVPNVNSQGINALHWYPAPFPAALVGTLIDILGHGQGKYLDPFCGSGVGVVEAWLRGYEAVGNDSNYWATRIVQAKIDLLVGGAASRGSELAKSYEYFRRFNLTNWTSLAVEEIATAAGMSEESTKWFDAVVMAEIACAKQWIAETDSATSPLLEVIFSSLLQKASILRDVHYTYIVDRSRTKVAPTSPITFAKDFATKLERSFRDAEVFRDELMAAGVDLPNWPAPRIIHGQSEALGGQLSRDVDLVVTSPPYFGMNDYVRSQYLSHLVQPWVSFEDDLKVESGSRRNRRSPERLSHYLESMKSTFDSISESLSQDGHLAIVLGGSKSKLASAHNLVPGVQEMLQAAGLRLIWEGQRRVRYRKINSGGHTSEVIWVYAR